MNIYSRLFLSDPKTLEHSSVSSKYFRIQKKKTSYNTFKEYRLYF